MVLAGGPAGARSRVRAAAGGGVVVRGHGGRGRPPLLGTRGRWTLVRVWRASPSALRKTQQYVGPSSRVECREVAKRPTRADRAGGEEPVGTVRAGEVWLWGIWRADKDVRPTGLGGHVAGQGMEGRTRTSAPTGDTGGDGRWSGYGGRTRTSAPTGDSGGDGRWSGYGGRTSAPTDACCVEWACGVP
jgi:hypothetical protein